MRSCALSIRGQYQNQNETSGETKARLDKTLQNHLGFSLGSANCGGDGGTESSVNPTLASAGEGADSSCQLIMK